MAMDDLFQDQLTNQSVICFIVEQYDQIPWVSERLDQG